MNPKHVVIVNDNAKVFPESLGISESRASDIFNIVVDLACKNSTHSAVVEGASTIFQDNPNEYTFAIYQWGMIHMAIKLTSDPINATKAYRIIGTRILMDEGEDK